MDLNPITLLVNLSRLFLPGVNLVFVIAGLFGLWIGYKALYDLYKHMRGDQEPGMMPKGAVIPVLTLAGACVVIPVVMWQGASVIVLGGDQTASMFSYLEQTDTSTTCDNVSRTMTMFCMLMGSISIFTAAMQAYSRVSEPGRGHSFGTPIIFFCGGVGLFFLNDIFYLASQTTHVNLGFSAICQALDTNGT
ncbi:hypothetical protein [Acetobacter malorum]|uniref:hypothetical protein n=3 Tax=Acetobacter malorum TaxID=178901 RepID=UPI00077702D4|nr:hypothetical protein [Acetobacter malorum]KXV08708.1 hypothetical protein AD930_03615 [Acetobacter malorum]